MSALLGATNVNTIKRYQTKETTTGQHKPITKGRLGIHHTKEIRYASSLPWHLLKHQTQPPKTHNIVTYRQSHTRLSGALLAI